MKLVLEFEDEKDLLMKTVAWLPAHPVMGWASMNRYWGELERGREWFAQRGWEVVCPLQLPATERGEGPSWKRWWERKVRYPQRVRRLRVEVVHVLDHSFAELLSCVQPRVRSIVTVHDLIPLYDATGMTARQVRGFQKRVSWLRQADALCCVSDYTRRCVQEKLSLSEEKLSVLPLGVRLPEESKTTQQRECSLLCVGTALARKNMQLLPAVVRGLYAQGLQVKVVKVGAALPAGIKAEVLAVCGAARLEELGYVSDAALEQAYARAGLMFFPSTMEGFGLPVLEAMAMGCPVVCSSVTSIPEVAGDAALLFDPKDASAAVTACARILCGESAAWSAKGLARACEMSWEKHWEGLLEKYEGR